MDEKMTRSGFGLCRAMFPRVPSPVRFGVRVDFKALHVIWHEDVNNSYHYMNTIERLLWQRQSNQQIPACSCSIKYHTHFLLLTLAHNDQRSNLSPELCVQTHSEGRLIATYRLLSQSSL